MPAATLDRSARLGDGWVNVMHNQDQVARLLAQLNGHHREYGCESVIARFSS